MSKSVDNRLLIKKLKTDKSKVKKSQMMLSKIIPEHPFRAIISGQSGSGKTVLTLNLLTENIYYKDYFDVIFVLSPTAGKLDDTYNVLHSNNNKKNKQGKELSPEQLEKDIKKKNKQTKVHFINDITVEKIQHILDINAKLIEEKGVENAPKILLLYDDVVNDKKLMNSKEFHNTFIASRHYNASVIICTQKYNAVHRTCRQQANAIFFFKGTESENKRIIDEFCPPAYSNKEFAKILNDATREKYSFLFINCQDDVRTRYRKCLHSIIVLKRHDGREQFEVKEDLDKPIEEENDSEHSEEEKTN